MRKFTFLVVCLFAVFNLSAQKQATRSLIQKGPKIKNIATGEASTPSKAVTKIFNYDNNEIAGGLGTSSAHSIGAVIQIPASALTSYVEQTIDAVRYGIDNKSIITDAKVVIYEGNLDGAPVVSQDIAVGSLISGWNMVSLTEGYKIPSATDIFVGIMVTTNAGGYTVCFDTDAASAPEYSGHLFFNGAYYGTLTGDVGIDADWNLQAILTDGNGIGEMSDLTITSVDKTTQACGLSATETLKVTLYNAGQNTINEKFDLTVEVNNTPVVQQVSATNFEPETEMVVEVSSFDMSAFGVYDVVATFDYEDVFTNNNTFETLISTGDSKVTIDLTTDAYPGETQWFLVDINGDVVATNGTLEAEAQYVTEVCVDAASCYTWVIYDAYGDGIMGYNSPAGTFTISFNGEVIATCPAGGDFGSQFNVFGLGNGCPENDIELSSLNSVESAPINSSIDVKGIVTNYGTSNLTSFDVTYNIDGGDNVATYNVSGIDIPIGETYNFTHNVQATFNSVGIFTINVKVSNPNGLVDDESDNTLSKEITIWEGGIQRTILVEEFSTEQCPNCPPVATYLAGIEDENENVVLMVHHAGYYTDDYTIPENEEMLVFYNDGGSTYAPAGMVDRHHNGLDNDEYDGVDPGPVFWPGNPYGETRINDRLSQPAFVEINFEGNFNTETKELTVNITGSFLADFSSGLGVSLWIIEDGITSTTQAGFTGEWTHHALVRDAISSIFGDPLTTTTNKDDEYSKSFTYTITDSEWVIENLSLVAFVNTIDENDVNNRAVHNTGKIKLLDLNASETVTVTFNVDMTAPIESGLFVAGTDVLYVTGNFNGWDEPSTGESLVLTDTDGDKTYTVSVEIATNYGELQYKYFRNAGWNGGEWNGEPNRIITVGTENITTNDTWVVGIGEDLLNAITISPNPFKDELVINNADNATRIVISNVLGQAVVKVSEISNRIELSTSELQNGVYFITITDANNNSRIERIVKQ